MTSKQTSIAVFLVAIGAIGGFSGAQFFGGNETVVASGEPDILYWVAPMDSNYRRDEPGQSPMGMDLVPVYADDGGAAFDGEPSIRISPTVINNIGVRTASVERQTMRSLVRTVGNVQPNEELTHHVHVRAEGWIENLVVRTAGEEVSEGDLLFQYYAPDLVNAQAEFVQALQSNRSELVIASRERLQALGMSQQQIESIQTSRTVQQLVDIRAPQDGVVIELNVGDGMFVQPGMTILSLADLSSVWVLVDVFEDDAPAMAAGLETKMRLPFLPTREWVGEVDYIYPTINPVSRTLSVRLAFDETHGALMPNMYGDVEIHGPARTNVLAVPTEAVIRSSEGSRVILALGGGRFRPARVEIGIEADNLVEITNGLEEGENIVTSGQFLIDSEASLNASLIRMTSHEGEVEMAQMDMPGMDHSDADAGSGDVIHSRGVIVNVMVDHNMVRMIHEPIPELSWPEMNMSFDYVGEAPLMAMDEGTEVTFTLGYEMQEDGTRGSSPVITSIMMASDQDAAADEVIQSRGVIVNVMVDHNMVRVVHEPIPELSWPEMNMSFDYVGDAPLMAMDEGTEVTFTLGYEMQEDGTRGSSPVITSIAPVSTMDHGAH